jgi:ABC-type uncharacterized transport system permease subunit
LWVLFNTILSDGILLIVFCVVILHYCVELMSWTVIVIVIVIVTSIDHNKIRIYIKTGTDIAQGQGAVMRGTEHTHKHTER